MNSSLYYLQSPGYFSLVRIRWQKAFTSRSFRIQFWMTMAYLVCLVIFLNFFFQFIQGRPGVRLNDPLLSFFHPVNLSPEIFGILYICALIGLANLMTVPDCLLRGLEAMAIIYTLRIFTLYFVPLDPPAGMIVLSDPFILHFAYSGKTITKDLFFSGHTTSMLVLLVATDKKALKALFTISLVAIIYMLLWERVHYTIDIIGAFVFTLGVWRITALWWKPHPKDLPIQAPH